MTEVDPLNYPEIHSYTPKQDKKRKIDVIYNYKKINHRTKLEFD